MTFPAKRGSHLSNGLSSEIRSPVLSSAEIMRVLHCCNHFHSHTCVNHRILECSRARFIIVFQNDSSKTKQDLSFTTLRSRLTIPAVSTNQNWKRVSVFLSENRRRQQRSFFLSILPIVQFDVVHHHLDLQHKQHTNSCRQDVLNLHVLVSLCSLDSSDSF